MAEPQFYVWSMEHDAWWPLSRVGYVTDLREAGRFSRDEAAAIVQRANYPPGTCHECMIPAACLEARDLSSLDPAMRFALQQIVAHYLTVPDHSEVFYAAAVGAEPVAVEDVLRFVMGWPAVADLVAQAQREVARGATHDCGEWVQDGQCAVCGATVS